MLIHGDCIEELKKLKDNTVDLLFCDLPYGQTNCQWDCLIDLSQFWKEVNRVCKDTTPMFFCCSTRFGVSLINSNPKNFRYDMVWVKSSPCGFLNAKKMPMKKHEMLYVFYRKLPLYDLSSHTHKFIKPTPRDVKLTEESIYGTIDRPDCKERQSCSNYEPALPTTVIKEEKFQTSILYGNGGKDKQKKTPRKIKILEKAEYVPTLPTSILREECESLYGTEKGKVFIYDEDGKLRNSETRYEPPLPVTVLRETDTNQCYDGNVTYNYEERDGAIYEPPLPNSILEIKSEKRKHATQKPTALIEWCLKYYSKEGDTILDPTAGSGSTAVACKNMKRNYICIEKDPEIFKVMEERLK